MLNHITIMGRLVRDPELRSTQSGTNVASFTVAVDRDRAGNNGEKQTDFIDCVAWRQTGEFVSKHFHKGSMIVVSGRLQSRKWQDRDGNNRTNWEVNADNVYFGESRRDSDSGRDSYSGNAYSNNSYGGGYNNNSYSSNSYSNSYGSAPAPGYGGYNAPAGNPASDFAMLDDDDAQLPF